MSLLVQCLVQSFLEPPRDKTSPAVSESFRVVMCLKLATEYQKSPRSHVRHMHRAIGEYIDFRAFADLRVGGHGLDVEAIHRRSEQHETAL